MTEVGGSGFSFIDQEARTAQSVDQLAWIAAHNISHELMLAFGVGENYDQTGQFIDARNANWNMITGANATFSTAASQAINQALLSPDATAPESSQLAQVLDPEPVPEPATLVLWTVVATLLVIARTRRTMRRPL
jgi:hypothetical protein